MTWSLCAVLRRRFFNDQTWKTTAKKGIALKPSPQQSKFKTRATNFFGVGVELLSLLFLTRVIVDSCNRLFTPFIPQISSGLGMTITASGMALEFSTQIFLGRNYSTTLHIGEKQSLVTTGPYRYIRHPMYTALVAVGIGMGLMSSSWYFLIPFIATGIVNIFRTRREEEAMIEKFGDEYVQYTQRTGRFLPMVGRKKPTTEDERV